jgi:cytosine permease
MSEALTASVAPPQDDHLRDPVPEAETVPGWQIGLVCIGIGVTLPGLYAGGELARGLGLLPALAAVVLGSSLVALMSIPAAIVGRRTRLSTYMIVEHVFGRVGAKVVNGVLAITLLGWFAVTAELFGRTLALAAAELDVVAWPRWTWILLGSGLVTATTLYGFRALDRLALVVVPPLTLFLGWSLLGALDVRPFGELLALPGTGMRFTDGVSIVVGGMIVAVVLLPDLARYARRDGDAVVAAVMGNGVGTVICTPLAMVPALAFGVLDPVSHFALLGYGVSAVVAIVLATWTTNGINLWSTTLVAGTALPRARYATIVLGASVVGTGAALVGVADRLTDFLILLGLLVPPVAGVYLTRFFLLGRRDFSAAALDARPAGDPVALGAAGIAAAAALAAWVADVSLTGVSSIESLVLAGGLTLLGDRLLGERAA